MRLLFSCSGLFFYWLFSCLCLDEWTAVYLGTKEKKVIGVLECTVGFMSLLFVPGGLV